MPSFEDVGISKPSMTYNALTVCPYTVSDCAFLAGEKAKHTELVGSRSAADVNDSFTNYTEARKRKGGRNSRYPLRRIYIHHELTG